MKIIINCQKGTRKLYQEIAESRYIDSDKELGMALLFCLAVSLGYRKNKYDALTKKDWLTREEFIERNTEMKRFLEAVAVAHSNNLEVLSDNDKVYEIAESYANGGITDLYAMVINESPLADFDRQIELLISKIVKDKNLEE